MSLWRQHGLTSDRCVRLSVGSLAELSVTAGLLTRQAGHIFFDVDLYLYQKAAATSELACKQEK